MNKPVLIAVVLVVLLFDWVALDDITTGNEPSFLGEYAMLIVSVVVLGVVAWFWQQKERKS